MPDPYNIAKANAKSVTPSWLTLMLAAGILVMIVGGLLGLFAPGRPLVQLSVPQTHTAYANHFAIRNLTLAIALIALYAIRARRSLGNLAAIVGVTQVFDAIADFTQRRCLFGLLVLAFAVLLFLAAARLSGHSFWQRAAWVE